MNEEDWGKASQVAWDALPEGMYSRNGERSAFDDGYRAARKEAEDGIAPNKAALEALLVAAIHAEDEGPFAKAAFRTLHWILSPDCRTNHLDWDPALQVL